MSFDIAETYFKNKKNNIINYSLLLVQMFSISDNRIWINKKTIETSLNKMISEYLIEYYLKDQRPIIDQSEQEKLLVLIKKYPIIYDFNKIKVKYSIFEMLCFVFDYLKIGNAERLISNDLKEIIYMALILWISIILDYYSCSLLEDSINPKVFINDLISIVRKHDFMNNTGNEDSVNKLINEGLINYKNDITFFELLNSKTSFNTYCKISKNKYLAKYNINIPNLEKYNDSEIAKAYKSCDMENKTFSLLLKNINVTILKEILLNIPTDVFYVPYLKKYWQNKNSVKIFDRMFNSKYLKNKVVILIPKEDNESIIKCFNENNILYEIDNQLQYDNEMREKELIESKMRVENE